MFSQIFSIIQFVAKELHLPEVEGVEIVCFFLKSSQNVIFIKTYIFH
jgi:hypothetical protein